MSLAVNSVQKKSFRDQSLENHMGAPSYEISNPVKRLEVAAASCFFGEPSYYQRDRNKRPFSQSHSRGAGRPMEELIIHLTDVLDVFIEESLDMKMDSVSYMEKMIDSALDYDVEATLALAASLRNDFYIRTTPQIILVRASKHADVKGTGLIRDFGVQIIGRVDDMTTQLAYHLHVYGKSVSSAMKRLWKCQLENRFDEYGLAKYRMSSRAVNLMDLVRFCHAKGEHIDKLMKGQLKLNGATWESLISENGSSQENWTQAIDKMGHMALLRNLRNFAKNDVDPSMYLDKLQNTVKGSKQLPFRYYSAYKAVEENGNPRVLDAIEGCMKESLLELPRFKGRVASLCDNSGSARGTMTSSMGSVYINEIANLTGVLTGMCAEEGYVGVFGDNLEMMPVLKAGSILNQAKEANQIGDGIGGGTENGIWLFWDKAIRNKEHWDTVFVYSDMQAGHCGLFGNDSKISESGFVWPGSRIYGDQYYVDVPKLIQEYRSKVNPNVQVFLVQMAGYDDTIIPQFFDKTYILGGWSDAVLRFADKMINVSEGETL